jgi:hypothetical protein
VSDILKNGAIYLSRSGAQKIVVATLVKHIYNKLSTAQNIFSKNKIKKLELQHIFHVKSEDVIS